MKAPAVNIVAARVPRGGSGKNIYFKYLQNGGVSAIIER